MVRPGVVRRNRVRFRAIHIQPENRAQQGLSVLAAAQGVTAPSSVTHPDVQIAVGAEQQMTAVVVRVRLFDRQNQLGALRIRDVRVRPDPIAFDAGGTLQVREVHEQSSVGTEVRMKRDAQQAAFTPARHPVRNVQERLFDKNIISHDPDPARLLDHEQPRVAGRGRQVHRVAEREIEPDQFERGRSFADRRIRAGGDLTLRATPAAGSEQPEPGQK